MGRATLSTTTTAQQPLISKSKFLSGSQCRKLLWYAYNAKEQIPEPDDATQTIFDQGHEVGALGKSLYPGGIEVSSDAADFDQVPQQSLEAAKARKSLFEAGFAYGGGFARVDVLNPVGKDGWDIIEVKSSTEVKDVNLLDLVFQAFVCSGAGLSIRRCCLILLCYVWTLFLSEAHCLHAVESKDLAAEPGRVPGIPGTLGGRAGTKRAPGGSYALCARLAPAWGKEIH